MLPDGEADALQHAAAALALIHERTDGGIDLLHSRLAPAKRSWMTRRRRIAAIAAAVVIVALGMPWWIESQQAAELVAMQAQLKAINPDVEAARETVDRVREVEGWFADRPKLLDAMLALTLAFPASGETWATDITWREDLSAVITGKGTEQRSVLELRDRLQNSRDFVQVKLLYMRYGGRDEKEMSFALSLRYEPRSAEAVSGAVAAGRVVEEAQP
jgi:hypothetical protein